MAARRDDDIEMLPEALDTAVRELARTARRADGPVVRALNGLGGHVERWFAALPAGSRKSIDAMARTLLGQLYAGAGAVGGHAPRTGDWGHRLTAAATGAAGGAAGLPSAVVELPATVMVMFAAMQREASRAGFDPQSAEVRLACIEIFGSGGPGSRDDGVNTAFLGARLGMNGAALQTVITRALPAFSGMLGRSLAGKAVPVIGAVAGAGINFAFTGYYQDLARVRFGLMRLAEEYGAEQVRRAFRAEMARSLPR